MMQDYSAYIINAQKFIRAIEENANKNNYKVAFEMAYHLGTLSDMLKESLLKHQNK